MSKKYEGSWVPGFIRLSSIAVLIFAHVVYVAGLLLHDVEELPTLLALPFAASVAVFYGVGLALQYPLNPRHDTLSWRVEASLSEDGRWLYLRGARFKRRIDRGRIRYGFARGSHLTVRARWALPEVLELDSITDAQELARRLGGDIPIRVSLDVGEPFRRASLGSSPSGLDVCIGREHRRIPYREVIACQLAPDGVAVALQDRTILTLAAEGRGSLQTQISEGMERARQHEQPAPASRLAHQS